MIKWCQSCKQSSDYLEIIKDTLGTTEPVYGFICTHCGFDNSVFVKGGGGGSGHD